MSTFKVLVNYNFTPDKEWIGDDYLIYDRSDDGIDHLTDFDPDKIIKTENVGQVDFDRLNYLIDNYDNLPEVFMLSKSNLFKYISREEYELVKDNQTFTPLLTANHKTYSDSNGVVCYYAGGIYNERADVAQAAINQFACKHFETYGQFAHAFQLPNPNYIPFFPGGNCILTRERVHRFSVDYYKNMASVLPYAREPAEAQMVERALYSMWK